MLLLYLCTQMSSKRGYRLLKEESQGAAGEEEEADEETSPISRTEGGSTLLADVENQSKPGECPWRPLRSSWASEAPRGATAEACNCSVSMACLQLLRWRMPGQASEYASSTRRWVGQADPWYWRARFLSRMRCTAACCAFRAGSITSTSSRLPSPSQHSRPRSRRWRMCPRRCRG